LGFGSQFELVVFVMESSIKNLNSASKVAHSLEEGRNSSLIGHLNKLHEHPFNKDFEIQV